MALPDSAKFIIGTAIIWADTTDYSPAAASSLGARTDQIDLTSLAAAAARQGAKVDFGANLDVEYVLAALLEFATAPVSKETVSFYIGWSHSATAANANPGNLTGADAAYTGSAADSLDNTLPQLDHIGDMVCTADATTTLQTDTAIATFTPRDRYGSIVVVNNTSDAIVTDAVEMAIRATPLTLQTQD